MFSKIQYKNIVAFIFTLAVFLELTDTFIVNVAFPSMAVQLGVSISSLGWVVNSYMLSVALILPFSAYLGDRFGRKRVFLIAIVIFTFASLFCAYSNHLGTLIFARSLQGVGAGMLVPVGQTMLFAAFPKSELIKIMSIVSVPILVAPALSQVIGGIFVEYLSWRWIFLVNLPIGLFCFFMSAKYLIEEISSHSIGFDFIGMILSAGGFVMLFYSFSRFEFNQPFHEPLLLLFAALVILSLFAWQSFHSVKPFLNLKVFKNEHFRWSIFCFILVMASCMGSFVVYNFFAQETLHLSPFQSGFLSVPFCFGMLLITRILHRLHAKYGSLPLFLFGVSLYIVGTLSMIYIDNSNKFILLCVLYFLRGLGQGFLGIILQTVALQTMPKENMSHASTILSMTWYLSVSLGVAFFTLFISFMMNFYGIIPVSFSSVVHRSDIVNIFRALGVLSVIMYAISGFLFCRIDHKKKLDDITS